MSSAIELVKAHLAAENAQDVAATLATFADDCFYRIPAQGIDLRGKERIGAYYATLFATFPDFVNVEGTYYEAADNVFVELSVRRTHTNAWGPVPASGRVLHTSSLAHFPLAADGLLAGEIVYLNPVESLYQTGALPSADLFEVAAELARLREQVARLTRAAR